MRLVDAAMLLALVVLILFWLELELNSLDRRFSARPDSLDSLSAEPYRGTTLSDLQLRCLSKDFQRVSLAVHVLIAQSPKDHYRLGCSLVRHQAVFLIRMSLVRTGLYGDTVALVKRYERLLSAAKAAHTHLR